jgi:hypothetical protein
MVWAQMTEQPLAPKGKSKREDAFIKKVLSWEETIKTLLSKWNIEQAWQFINLLPLMDTPIKSVAYHQGFLDFTDYFILRRDIENCPDGELCNLTMLHTEFQKQIENNKYFKSY